MPTLLDLRVEHPDGTGQEFGERDEPRGRFGGRPFVLGAQQVVRFLLVRRELDGREQAHGVRRPAAPLRERVEAAHRRDAPVRHVEPHRLCCACGPEIHDFAAQGDLAWLMDLLVRAIAQDGEATTQRLWVERLADAQVEHRAVPDVRKRHTL